jgi:hypothetical protein
MWDEDECQQAIDTAQSLMEADPDGARQLLAQAQVRQRQLRPLQTFTGHEPFDPMKLYSDVAKYYHFSDSDMEQMHYPKFFGYVREAQLKIEAERKESDRIRNQGSNATYTPGADGMGVEGFPVARPYEGETVAR